MIGILVAVAVFLGFGYLALAGIGTTNGSTASGFAERSVQPRYRQTRAPSPPSTASTCLSPVLIQRHQPSLVS